MARKDLLKGLMDQNAAAKEGKTKDADKTNLPRYSTGSIGAVSQSIADLKSRAVIEIDPDLILAGGLKDRFDDHQVQDLAQSIQEYGQQVPVLLRRITLRDGEDRYQIVYGRRRVAAMKLLGKPVKALVRSLTDRQVILAQGQENAARKDLSFIEKANFARQMRDMGYERKTICDALHVDKTVISRMLSIIDRIPFDLIAVIGSAPSAGRDRWLKLADALKDRDLRDHAKGEDSDARFEAVFTAATRKAPKPVSDRPRAFPRDINTFDGKKLAHVKQRGKRTDFAVEQPEFAKWLSDHLVRLHKEWQRDQGE